MKYLPSLLTLLLTITGAHAAEIQVAVAANFSAPAQRIAADFEQASGHTVHLAFGATGKFYAQIIHGAPFDVFLAADSSTPAKLAQNHSAIAASRFPYAVGRLVLWSAQPGLINNAPAILSNNTFKHLAVANPKTAPYGAAAVETLKNLNQLNVLQPKFVQGENIAQTHQFVSTGHAELGFVAVSQVFKNGTLQSGSAWVVPKTMHSPISQEAVLLQKGANKPAAQAFLNYLKSPPARLVIEQYGYDLP